MVDILIMFVGCGRFADYWKGIYTGPLPNGYDKNTVCLKVAKCE